MFKLFFSLLLLLPFIRVQSQSEIDGLIRKGLEFSLDFQVERANEIFSSVISKHPSDPRGYHYKSSISLWLYLSNKKQKDYDIFIKYSDLTIKNCEEILDNKDDDLIALYTLGANYGFRAMAFMKSNSNLNAIWAVKNSNKYLKETLKINSKHYDAYLGLGLFNYALSFVPGVIKWTLKLAGISGNREEGIQFLNLAYRRGDYTRSEAAYYLSQIYSETIIDYNKSAGYLKNLVKKYPNNCLFRYSYAVALIKDRKLNEAERILTQIIKENNQQFTQILAYSNFSFADIQFRKNDFNNAIRYYEKFLSLSSETDYSGIVYYRLALSYELLEKREEGQKYYILARNGNLDLPDDAYAKRKSEIYFDRPLSHNEKEIIRINNLIESGNYYGSLELLNNLLPKINSDKLKSEAYLYFSDAYYGLENYNEALNFAKKAVHNNVNGEKWIHPFAYYYGARSLLKLNRKTEAEEYLNKAADYNDFDYQQKLNALSQTLRLKMGSN